MGAAKQVTTMLAKHFFLLKSSPEQESSVSTSWWNGFVKSQTQTKINGKIHPYRRMID
jgi:hypothetical protein